MSNKSASRSSVARRKFGNNSKNMVIDEDMFDADELEALAKEADDADQGKNVSFLSGDAVRWMNKHKTKHSSQAKHVNPSRQLQLRAIFRGLDFDNSGSISLEELKEAVNYVAKNSSGSSPAIEDPDKMNKFFESMDADGSGSLDFEEFLFGMTAESKESNDNESNKRLQEVFFDFANQHRRQMLIDKIKDKKVSDLVKFEDLQRLFSIKFFKERQPDEEGDAMDQLVATAAKEKKEMITPNSIKMRKLEFERAKLAKYDLDRKRSLTDPESFHTQLVHNLNSFNNTIKEERLQISDRVSRNVNENLHKMDIPVQMGSTVITSGLVHSRSRSEVELKRYALTTSRSLKSLSNSMFVAPPVARKAALADKKALLDTMYK